MVSEWMKGKLGRRFAPDDRDASYPLRRAVSLPDVSDIPENISHRIYWRGDQGQEGACVGFAIVHRLHTAPIPQMVKGKFPPVVDPVTQIYRPAQLIDEFTSTPPEIGTSVRAGMKIAQQLGYFESYHWTTDFDEMLRAIALGPVIWGINWYESMFDVVDPRGLVTVSGALAGGHAICVIGYDLHREEFILLNSWGPSFGDHGKIRIGFKDARRLISEDAEICLPKECKPKKQVLPLAGGLPTDRS